MLPSWIVIRCLIGRGLVQRQGGGGALIFPSLPLPPRQIFPCPNPPQLPNQTWWPNTKMCTRVPKIHLYCMLVMLPSNSVKWKIIETKFKSFVSHLFSCGRSTKSLTLNRVFQI